MNRCNIEFLERNGIDIEKVTRSVDTHIYSAVEKNEIVGKYGFQRKGTVREVSVADIVGYNTKWRKVIPNIFASLDNFFKETGDDYHTRSLGLLQYGKDDIMEKLQPSFKYDPIWVLETGEGEYTVEVNGLHRMTVLRTLYLSEAADAQGNQEELERIAKKYTIPAKVIEIDLPKTYCKYLLMGTRAIDPKRDIARVEETLDENFRKTGEVSVTYNNGERDILDEDGLLKLTKERLSESVNDESLAQACQTYYDKYKSFREFMDKNFGDIMPMQKKGLEERGQEPND